MPSRTHGATRSKGNSTTSTPTRWHPSWSSSSRRPDAQAGRYRVRWTASRKRRGHAGEDPEGDFAHGGWTGTFMDEHRRYMREALSTMGALVLGRVTYDIWARHWPTVTDPSDEIARMLNTVPKYVASTRMREGSWSETTVIDDVPAQVAGLKQQ